MLKTHINCKKILCVREIWVWRAVSLKRIVGAFLFEEMGVRGETLKASTAVITHCLCRFCYPSKINTEKYDVYTDPGWPRRLKHRFADTHLLGLRVRIPPGHGCLSVVCVGHVQVSASG